MVQPRVVVTGRGVVSALGFTAGDFFESLCSGSDGLRAVSVFSDAHVEGGRAVEIAGFEPATFLGNRNFRPLDRTGRLAVTAAHFALADSGWTPQMIESNEVGLALGTVFCSVKTITEFDRNTITVGPKYAKPMDFANTVINAAAGQTALWHNLRGMNWTVAGGSTSGLQAIGCAADLIRLGRVRAMLAGGAEELCFESYYGFGRTGLLAGNGHGPASLPVPFGESRDGFALGEGAAFLMLEDLESAQARGAVILAEVLSHTGAFDLSRGKDEKRAVEALTDCQWRALIGAGIESKGADCIFASANGSVSHDRIEALALAQLAARTGAHSPVTAVKSVTGEALGASGGFAALALVESLSQGKLPAIRGFQRSAADCPLANPISQTQAIECRHGLVDAVGYDGNFSALVLARWP